MTQSFIQGNVYVFAGVGIGLLVFQIINIILAAGLAVDIHKEKKIIKAQKKQQKSEEMQKLWILYYKHWFLNPYFLSRHRNAET